MIQIIIGTLLLLSFFTLVIFAVKGGNMTIGILLMAVVWAFLPIIGNLVISDQTFIDANQNIMTRSIITIIRDVFQGGPEGWGGVLVNFLFGAWFGRVMLDTGIAATIIRKTVELGGDRPIITSTLLYIVTTAIFTSMFGTGAVIAIGVIVMPILLTLGIPKKVALVSFMLAVGAGLYINPLIFNQYQAFFLGPQGEQTYFYANPYLTWGGIALFVQMVMAILVTVLFMNKNKRVYAWAAPMPEESETQHAPGIALLTPFVPVILAMTLNVPVIASFLVASFFALKVCGKLKGGLQGAGTIMSKTFYDGAVDTAPLMAFVLVVPMFNKSAELAVPYFNALLGGVIPQSTLLIAIVFALLAPLGLFRGPLTLAGSGAATLGILKGLGFSTGFLFPLFYVTTITMNISSCLTQSWIVWGLNYTKVNTTEFLKMSIPAGWIITIILSCLTYIMFG